MRISVRHGFAIEPAGELHAVVHAECFGHTTVDFDLAVAGHYCVVVKFVRFDRV